MSRSNSERFLAAFSRIEHCVRNIAKGSRQDRFGDLLSHGAERNATVRRFENDLREFAELRNAIVHDRGGGYPIAEPHQETVEKLEEIEKLISKPPTVESLGSRQVITCHPHDPIGKAAKGMLEGKFSQLPVYRDKKFIGLLTSETVARWIADKFQPDLNILEEESVEQVLHYQEEDSVCMFVLRTTPIVEVLALFDEIAHSGKSLDAVIITHSGDKDQTPLNILTVFDLPGLYRRAGFSSD